MRRMFAFLLATVDGYHSDPNGELDWQLVDDEFKAYGVEQLSEVDTLVFGRRTYEGMAEYWTTAEAYEDDPQMSDMMNSLAKIVVSKTLAAADWPGTRLLTHSVAGEFEQLKRLPGRDIAILGSPTLTASLLPTGLVDEIRIMINPIALGNGRSMFSTATEPISLKLMGVRSFKSGNVLLTYQPLCD